VVDARRSHCLSLVEDAVSKGAELLVSGETAERDHARASGGLTPDMKLFRDESFGPVVGIIRARRSPRDRTGQ
jgi:acyl-CoA reductase-like NAD-dependent aldehyde dehydrogenase